MRVQTTNHSASGHFATVYLYTLSFESQLIIALDKLLISNKKHWYFSYFSIKTCCEHSLELPCWGTPNEYPHLFLWRVKKNFTWIPILIKSYVYVSKITPNRWFRSECTAQCTLSAVLHQGYLVTIHQAGLDTICIISQKAVSHFINNCAFTGENLCIKAIHALFMYGYTTFNMIVPGPQICYH